MCGLARNRKEGLNIVKRLLTIAATVAAVAALPAVAIGAGGNFNGGLAQTGLAPAKNLPDESMATLRFKTRTLDGKIVLVKNFNIAKVPAKCNGDVVKTVKFKIKKMTVSNNKFNGKIQNKKRTFRVTGKFSNKGQAAKGTITVKGQLGSAKGCKSGKLKWSAGIIK